MGDSSGTEFHQAREQLWSLVQPTALKRIRELRFQLELLATDPADQAARATAIGLSHSVAGSAGVYGRRDAAVAAAAAEASLRAFDGDLAELRRIVELVEDARRMVEEDA